MVQCAHFVLRRGVLYWPYTLPCTHFSGGITMKRHSFRLAARNLPPTSTLICKQSPISTRSAEASSRAFYFSVRMPPYSVRQKSIEGRQKVTKWYGSSGCFWLVPGIYGNVVIFCFAIKSICTKAALVIAHIVQSSLSVLDFLCKLCHTIATGNVPDNVSDSSFRDEGFRQWAT